MRLLIDTHALIWYYTENPRLPVAHRLLFADAQVDVAVSYVSLWELAIKTSIRKLDLGVELQEFVDHVDDSPLSWLGISTDHLVRLAELPLHHRDPFDRLLAAQCLVEKVTLLSADPAFDNYGVDRRW